MTVTAGVSFASARGTDEGRQRANNEDRAFIDPDLGVFMVIDGVGGQAAGEEAAAIAEEMLRERLKRPTGSVPSRIREAITMANNEIFDRAQNDEECKGMACVLTVAVLDANQMFVGHVGDTRLYKVCQGKIRKVTHDHSPVGEREDRGEISEVDAMAHPRRNEVYRDVGSEHHDTHEEDFIEILTEPFEPDSAWLMCTDGLTDLVTSGQIHETINRHGGDLSTVVTELINAANEAGGTDNITVVYIEGESFAQSVRGALSVAIRSDQERPARADEPPTTPRALGAPSVASRSDQEKPARADEARTTPKTIGALDEAERARETEARTNRFYEEEQARGLRMTVQKSDDEPERGAARDVVARILASRWAIFIYGALFGVLLLTLLQVQFGVGTAPPGGGPSRGYESRILLLGPGPQARFATITQALEESKAGDTIEVAPGEYHEQIKLKDGVSVISKKPGEAIIRPSEQASERGVAVIGSDLSGGRFVGFKILGGEGRLLSIGVRLVNANVEIADLDVSTASKVAVEIGGTGAAILRANYIHDNPGGGVIITGEAAPRLSHNLIRRNASQQKQAGIQIIERAHPALTWNLIYDNGAEGISGLSEEGRAEVLSSNFFRPGPQAKN